MSDQLNRLNKKIFDKNKSYNQIESIGPLAKLSGSKLEKVSLVANKLSSFKEIKIFDKFNTLKSIDIYDENMPNNNPFCDDLNTLYSEFLLLKNIKEILIDGKTTQ